MALTFGAVNSDRVDCGRNAGVDTMSVFTLLVWVKTPASLPTPSQPFVSKRKKANKGWALQQFQQGKVEFIYQRATSNLDYFQNTAVLNVASTWYCVAITFDSSASANNKVQLYTGTLTADLAAGTFSTTTDGSGTFVDDSAEPVVIGNIHNASGVYDNAWSGDIAEVAIVSRVLTLGEMIAWQWSRVPMTSELGSWVVGYGGTGTQPDLSGNGLNGTVTGATQAAHAPLPMWRQRRAQALADVATEHPAMRRMGGVRFADRTRDRAYPSVRVF
jgi:hypothetical protein